MVQVKRVRAVERVDVLFPAVVAMLSGNTRRPEQPLEKSNAPHRRAALRRKSRNHVLPFRDDSFSSRFPNEYGTSRARHVSTEPPIRAPGKASSSGGGGGCEKQGGSRGRGDAELGAVIESFPSKKFAFA